MVSSVALHILYDSSEPHFSISPCSLVSATSDLSSCSGKCTFAPKAADNGVLAIKLVNASVIADIAKGQEKVGR